MNEKEKEKAGQGFGGGEVEWGRERDTGRGGREEGQKVSERD